MFWMFLIGCFVGCAFGVFWMCVFQINRDYKDEMQETSSANQA